eukprot:Hpha_TRINITY_DN7388_c1_g1::TRINITY_DN7388_c1_g1_i1::g.9953::m.9953
MPGYTSGVAEQYRRSAASLLEHQQKLLTAPWLDSIGGRGDQIRDVVLAMFVVAKAAACPQDEVPEPSHLPLTVVLDVVRQFLRKEGLLGRLAGLEDTRLPFSTLITLQNRLEGDAFLPTRRALPFEADLVAEVISSLYECQCSAACPSPVESPTISPSRPLQSNYILEEAVSPSRPASGSSGGEGSPAREDEAELSASQVLQLEEMRQRRDEQLDRLKELRCRGAMQQEAAAELALAAEAPPKDPHVLSDLSVMSPPPRQSRTEGSRVEGWGEEEEPIEPSAPPPRSPAPQPVPPTRSRAVAAAPAPAPAP